MPVAPVALATARTSSAITVPHGLGLAHNSVERGDLKQRLAVIDTLMPKQVCNLALSGDGWMIISPGPWTRQTGSFQEQSPIAFPAHIPNSPALHGS
jgi:hypothetical protein